MSPTKDTPEKMEALADWLGKVQETLELDPADFEPIQGPMLDLISKIAHGPSRPGAPLTAYLIGMAAKDGKDPLELIEQISKLAD